MNYRDETGEAPTTATHQLPIGRVFGILLLLVQTVFCDRATTQSVPTPATTHPAPLAVEQVVSKLVEMNRLRAQSLQEFHGTRVYRADYKGLGGARSAVMVVDVKYVSPGTKEFTVRSATGSKLIIDRVFKKLLEAEQEALNTDMQRHSALTQENYRFTIIGSESDASGQRYVLGVEPLRKDKFLYRGKIWVDAKDFAVVRLEAEPAKNPSFWIKNTDIVHVYAKTGDFWLPAYNHSVTAIRLGGHADLAIEYKDYKIDVERSAAKPTTGMAPTSGGPLVSADSR